MLENEKLTASESVEISSCPEDENEALLSTTDLSTCGRGGCWGGLSGIPGGSGSGSDRFKALPV